MRLLHSKSFLHYLGQYCCSFSNENSWIRWRILQRGFACRVVHPVVSSHLHVSEEVSEALQSGKGVVALESTIITHGMPFPHNLSTALSVERKIRNSGSVPATVAVLDGQLRIGLNEAELHMLAEKSSQLIKISRRDLSYVLSQKLSGGTTVSGTMIAAHMAGISVFATGGIGGVHRGAEASFDVSADLTELGRTPVAVVSSGVKSILDIPKTLEYLETQGVFVSSFGDFKNFPAFFTPDSGCQAPYSTPTVYEAAQIISTQLKTGLSSGMLFAVPIPEEFSAGGETIERAVQQAVQEAVEHNVSGKAVTPFILDQVNRLTGGESLQANIALVENNARVAGGIARCLSLIQQGLSQEDIVTDLFVKSFSAPLTEYSYTGSSPQEWQGQSSSDGKSSSSISPNEVYLGRPIVVGATVMDLTVQFKDENFQMNGATYQGKVNTSFGGVGRNLADGLSRMDVNPLFVSAVGTDSHASSLPAACPHMDLGAIQKLDLASTATYCPILTSSGQLLYGVGDMDINDLFSEKDISHLQPAFQQAPIVVIDGNFSPQLISYVVETCHAANVPVWFEPTDVHKATKPFESEACRKVTLTSPNLAELRVMWAAHMRTGPQSEAKKSEVRADDLSELIDESLMMCRDLVALIPVIIVTFGHHGALLCHSYGCTTPHLGLQELRKRPETPSFQALFYPAVTDSMEVPVIASVSGAGDCLNAAVIASILQGQTLAAGMKSGMLAAMLSLHSKIAVPESISPVNVTQEVAEGWGWLGGLDVTEGLQETSDDSS